MFRLLVIIGIIVAVLVWAMPRLVTTHGNAEKATERSLGTLYEANDKLK